MKKQLLLPAVLAGLVATALGQAAPDYSREPFVVEQVSKRVEFQNNGASTTVQAARVQIKSEAGVKALGQLIFGYNAGNERLDIAYVRVTKPNGQVLLARDDAVQDLSSPVARTAPVYTDYRQKHVTVPGLRPGDRLEYSVMTIVQTPMAPGQFWLTHSFARNLIVLDERLEVSVPLGRAVKLKTAPGADPVITDQGDRRLYRWTSSHKVREDEEAAKRRKKKQPEGPDVQLSTFASWEEVGQWYAGLERDRRLPTPEIKAKAAELVRGRKTDLEKLEAIYDYVAKNVRYVSLSFGIGRYEPHAAAEILANQYGDCKDKHTLLAALAEAAGLHAAAVLIPSSRKLDPEVPSPAQFDHVISLVRVGKEDVWLDTTMEVAPFRLLASPLRHKQALVVPPSGGARLVETPADPPFPSRYASEVEGSLSSLGKLSLHVRQTVRGYGELTVRNALRRMPETRWKEFVGQVAAADFRGGEVSELKLGDPAATREPFALEFQLTHANYLDWSKKAVALDLPLPKIALAVADEDMEEPVRFGEAGETSQHLKLELPENYQARLPVPLTVTRDYGEYRSSYRLEGRTLTVERTLVIRTRELPAARARDFIAFRRAVLSDLLQKLSLETTSPAAASTASLNAKELEESGTAALNSGNYKLAAELLQRLVELEPQHKTAWTNLGNAYFGLKQNAEAIRAYQQQIAVNAYDSHAYNNLGLAFWQERKYEEAIAAFRKQIEVSPLDRSAHRNLGSLYVERHRYAEAAPELEKAASLEPNEPMVQVRLGETYLNLNQDEKALAAFARAAELGPHPVVWNNIAYSLSMKRAYLDRAQQYAESAVAGSAAVLRNLALEQLRAQDLNLVDILAASWDTLGWIRYQRGDQDRGERLIRAAWNVSLHGETAGHLAQIYEQRRQRDQAIQMYAQALASLRPPPETRTRLAALVGKDKVEALVERARGELLALRTLKLPGLAKVEGRAAFFVLLSPTKPHDAKFISGDEGLRAAAAALRSADFGFEFPDKTVTRILRRGTLSCTAVGDCTLVLEVPENVTSLD